MLVTCLTCAVTCNKPTTITLSMTNISYKQ